MYNKKFIHQQPMIFCSFQNALTGKQVEVLVRDYSQAFMLMKQAERTGAIIDCLDFSFRPVHVVIGGDE